MNDVTINCARHRRLRRTKHCGHLVGTEAANVEGVSLPRAGGEQAARGVRAALRPHVEPDSARCSRAIYFITWLIFRRTITRWTIADRLKHLHIDLNRIQHACWVTELAERSLLCWDDKQPSHQKFYCHKLGSLILLLFFIGLGYKK